MTPSGKDRNLRRMSEENAETGSAIGAALQSRRESQGLTLEGVAAQLRIRAVFLQAIEAGRIAELPGAAYALGFVRSYADFLGFDGAAMAAEYRRELNRVGRRFPLAWPKRQKDHRPFPGLSALLVILALAGGGYAAWQYRDRAEPPMASVPPVPAEIAAAAKPDPAPPPAPVPAPVSATVDVAPASPSAPAEPMALDLPAAPAALAAAAPEADFTGTDADAVGDAGRSIESVPAQSSQPEAADPVVPRLRLRAALDSWIEIRDPSGAIILQKLLRASEVYDPDPAAGWVLDTGNAGGLVIEIDGTALPALGAVGIIRRNIPLDPERLLQP